MTIDEVIKYCEVVAEKQEITAKSNLMEIDKIKADGILRLYDADEYESCMKCASEHRQLAEWLRELQELRELLKRTENRVHPACSECKYMKAKYEEQPCRNCCNNYRSRFEREVKADDKKEV